MLDHKITPWIAAIEESEIGTWISLEISFDLELLKGAQTFKSLITKSYLFYNLLRKSASTYNSSRTIQTENFKIRNYTF
jgi:hypothetical protein